MRPLRISGTSAILFAIRRGQIDMRLAALLLVAAPFLVPVWILIDSKKRLGRYTWGWALFSAFTLFGLAGQLSRDLQELSRAGATSGTLGMLWGQIAGAYFGAFGFYRALTSGKKKVEKDTEKLSEILIDQISNSFRVKSTPELRELLSAHNSSPEAFEAAQRILASRDQARLKHAPIASDLSEPTAAEKSLLKRPDQRNIKTRTILGLSIMGVGFLPTFSIILVTLSPPYDSDKLFGAVLLMLFPVLILIVPGWAIWYVAKRDQREADELNNEIRAMTEGVAILIVSLLASCGPSNEELRIREEARAKQQATLRTRQEALNRNAEERVRAGDKGPPKVYDDPGHRVATCYVPKPPDVAVSFETPFGKYVCGNSSAGKSVVERRKWYCKGESDNCVLSEWKNGQPTFGPVQDKFDMGKLGADFGWKIGPYPLR